MDIHFWVRGFGTLPTKEAQPLHCEVRKFAARGPLGGADIHFVMSAILLGGNLRTWIANPDSGCGMNRRHAERRMSAPPEMKGRRLLDCKVCATVGSLVPRQND